MIKRYKFVIPIDGAGRVMSGHLFSDSLHICKEEDTLPQNAYDYITVESDSFDDLQRKISEVYRTREIFNV